VARNLRDIAWTELGLPLSVRRLRPDVLHAPAFFAPKWGGVPLVVTVHDLLFRLHPEQYRRWWRLYVEMQLPRVLRRAAAIVVDSEQTRQQLVRDYNIPGAPVHVVHLGVDHARFQPLELAAIGRPLARYGLEPGYILFIGALHRRKNATQLVQAVARLKAEGILGNRKLVLVGPRALGLTAENDVMAVIRRHQLESNVCTLGWVADEDLPALYNGACVLAFPSSEEGFGLPVVEAMACGTPVVAGTSEAVKEVAGGAAHLLASSNPTALAQALAGVLTKPRLHADLRERGLIRSLAFDWGLTATRTADVYRSVVNGAALRQAV
jgi:glycosyltransferase involved in cell wall biosynthesis